MMKEKIIAISEVELKSKNIIFIDHIEQGFENYDHLLLSGTEENYFNFLEKSLLMNGVDNAFFDFYYHTLQEDEKSSFRDMLQDEDLKFLELFDSSQEIYFPLSEEILPFILKVTAREFLFSTFYFTKYPCTVWGNYGLKYPIFFLDENTKKDIS